MATAKKSPRWNPAVYKSGNDYHCYAVHTNGKVEKSAVKPDLVDAVLSADELCNMLNRYHRYGGKYKGTDKIVGRKVSVKTVERILRRADEAFAKYMEAHKKIFGAEE